jgi:pimeloyl-ACP methyl ester carboxylesterase
MNTNFPSQATNDLAHVETILLLHTYSSSKDEWITVKKFLERATGKSIDIIDPTITPEEMGNLDKCLETIVNHIHTKAKTNKVHIVGCSIGGHIAAHLRQEYPHLVKSVVITGYNDFSDLVKLFMAAGIWLLSCWLSLVFVQPRLSPSASRGVAKTLLLFPKMKTLPAIPTLIIAATGSSSRKKPVDDPEIAKRLRSVLSNNNQSEVMVKAGTGLNHRWHVERPHLCAELLLHWINNTWSDDLDKIFPDL